MADKAQSGIRPEVSDALADTPKTRAHDEPAAFVLGLSVSGATRGNAPVSVKLSDNRGIKREQKVQPVMLDADERATLVRIIKRAFDAGFHK